MEPTLTWLVGVLTVSAIGNIGQLTAAIIRRPPGNGKLNAAIKGEIALHENTCSRTADVIHRLEIIDAKLDRFIERH